jgi:hypothetical protein
MGPVLVKSIIANLANTLLNRLTIQRDVKQREVHWNRNVKQLKGKAERAGPCDFFP